MKPTPSISYDLFNQPPLSRRGDPETSHEAAARVCEFQYDHHAKILKALEYGNMGKSLMERHTGLTGVQIARRLPELEEAGLIATTGNNVKSNSGRNEREWGLVNKGRKVA